MEALEKGLKDLRVFAASWSEQHCQQAKPLRDPRDSTTNQSIYMEGPIALDTYVAEDGLFGHQWKKRPLGLRVFNSPV